MGRFYIGTSGYVYPHWRGKLYPHGLSQARWFDFYTKQFATVELNVTFYRLPDESTFLRWKAQSPGTFRFAVKGSRFVTHIKRLKDVGPSVAQFLKRVQLLGSKLSVILWQLPPSLKFDENKLTKFVSVLSRSRGVRHAFEIRHPSWLVARTSRILGEAGIALCEADWPGCPVSGVSTADFVYIRRHGAGALLYGGCYSKSQLRVNGASIKQHMAGGCDVFVYFNNDQNAYAVRNAVELGKLLGATTAPRQLALRNRR